jgi:hypothetical protein
VYDRKQKAQGAIMHTNRLRDSASALRCRAARPTGDVSRTPTAPYWEAKRESVGICTPMQPQRMYHAVRLHKSHPEAKCALCNQAHEGRGTCCDATCVDPMDQLRLTKSALLNLSNGIRMSTHI